MHMRNLLITLSSGLLLTLAVDAQAGNRLLRNNNPYLVQATAAHPTTSLMYNWGPVNPADYSNGVGVAAGTKSYRIIPFRTNVRYETRTIDGYTHIGRNSAATSAAGSGSTYEPATEMMGCKPNTAGTGLDPDTSKVVHSLAVNMPAPSAGQTYRVTRTLLTPVNIPPTFVDPVNGIDDIAIALKFEGGEEQDVADTQGFVASWKDGPTSYPTTGFIDPAGVITYSTDPEFLLWCSYTSNSTTINVYSDYGQRRIPALTPALLGHSVASYESDMGTTAATIGISLRGDSNYAGFAGVALSNISPGPLGVPLATIGGQVLEVNPADPFLTAFSAYIQTLDSNGDADGVPLPIPALPALTGLSLGFEYVIVDTISFAIVDSTGSAWISIN